ncbi:MAG: hypothetical protein KDK39_11340 [Leptospiraceae bacterium]|nr:hypothetical protein [Leptospiraceae bacterium]
MLDRKTSHSIPYPERPALATRWLALFLICSIIWTQCSSVEQLITYRSAVLPANLEQERKSYTGPRFRIVMLDFQNSARIDEFEVTADADLTTTGVDQSGFELQTNSTDRNTKTGTDESDPPGEGSTADTQTSPVTAKADLALLAREITETALFQSGRFEVVPLYQFEAIRKRQLESGQPMAEATRTTARELKIDYFLYGDLTDFEIKTATSYWKVPFWAILLIGSFFIDDDRTRLFVWEALLRAATIVPLDSALWKAGVGQQDIDLNVNLSLDLRLVEASQLLVVFSDSRTISRIESASNLELVVWQSDNKVRIKRSNAGKQIRFAAYAVTKALTGFVDLETGYQAPQTDVDSNDGDSGTRSDHQSP